MAKKRKSRPIEDQTTDDAVEAEEQEQGDDKPQNLEEDKEKDERDPDNDQEEEVNTEGTTGNEAKEAKVETNGQETEDEPVEKLLEPFLKEQLVLLLKEAVSKYPDLIESVEKIADADPAHRKIFVHGLGWDTNTETLISEYSRYGEIEDCKAVVDKVSGKSKGYGFILFKHRNGARKALKEPQKKIGNRITSCQLASAGPVPAPPPTTPPVSEYTQRKIFVSNVAAEIDPQKLLEFFSKFGEIEEGPLGLDKQTGKPKGFALFVYKSIESAKLALEEPHKNFEGHTLHCQKAIDGPKQGKGFYHSSKKGKYSGTHLMTPHKPAVPLAPAFGQALTALLATQGAGLGISNLLGASPQPVVSNSNSGGYGNQYVNLQMGQGGSRPQQQSGAPSYMGHGH